MERYLLILIIASLAACSKDDDTTSLQLQVTGVIHGQGVTTYQYGTHAISNSNVVYALKSDNINLDNYLFQTVTITGVKVSGYPVDNGPEYINVTSVQ